MSTNIPATAEALVELLRRRRCSPGHVVVDLISDDDTMAKALRSEGLVSIGVAADQAGADRLSSMGMEVVTGDLSKPDDVLADVVLALGERFAAAVWLGDLPARSSDMPGLVRATHWFGEQTGATLVVAVPNVTHVDVGTKVMLGRWEPRRGGVLDDRHVRHFSAESLRSTMLALGWAEVDTQDIERVDSDQHFPADAVPLERTTPVGAQLAALRHMGGPGASTEYLVRSYEAVMPVPPDTKDGGERVPFLSVLVRTQGKRWETLQEALLCLAAQTCVDFEVLVLVHDPAPGVTARVEALVAEFHPSFSTRVRVVEVEGGGRCRPLNEGARQAPGRYLATLDDDDLVFAHWVDVMRTTSARAPEHAVRVGVATQQIAAAAGAWGGEDGYEVLERPHVNYPLTFDYIEHLGDNLTPNNGYAVPRSIVTDLGQPWDESLPVLEDWDHLLRSAAICGVASAPTVAAMLRVWSNAEDSKSLHATEVWEETRQRIVAEHDRMPLLLDRGYVSKLRALVAALSEAAKLEQRMEELRGDVGRLTGELAASEARRQIADEAVDALEAARADVQARLDAVLSSRSWQLAQTVRAGMGTAKRWAATGDRLLREWRGRREADG